MAEPSHATGAHTSKLGVAPSEDSAPRVKQSTVPSADVVALVRNAPASGSIAVGADGTIYVTDTYRFAVYAVTVGQSAQQM